MVRMLVGYLLILVGVVAALLGLALWVGAGLSKEHTPVLVVSVLGTAGVLLCVTGVQSVRRGIRGE